MCRLHRALCALLGGAVFLLSCRPKYSYDVGFRNCTDAVLWMSVSSSTYQTELAVPLQAGQISEDNMVSLPMPAEMKLTWWTSRSEKRSETHRVLDRLPPDFDLRRDALWFVACRNAEPTLIAEIGSQKTGIVLHNLLDGRRWTGKSIHQACDLCASGVLGKPAITGQKP